MKCSCLRVQSRTLVCTTCAESYSLPRNGLVAPHDHRCPLCSFQVRTTNFVFHFASPLTQPCLLQVVAITNTEKNTTYTLCPYCSVHPPAGLDTSRCFLCTANCPLAKGGGEQGITPCPECGDRLRVVKTKARVSIKSYSLLTCLTDISHSRMEDASLRVVRTIRRAGQA